MAYPIDECESSENESPTTYPAHRRGAQGRSALVRVNIKTHFIRKAIDQQMIGR